MTAWPVESLNSNGWALCGPSIHLYIIVFIVQWLLAETESRTPAGVVY